MAILLATNLVYYAGWDVLNSHAVSFVLAAMFLYVWVKTKSSLLLGALLGMMISVRTQDAVFGILLLTRQNKIRAIFGVAIAMLPQLWIWQHFYNWQIPYLGTGQNFDWFGPHIWGVLTNVKTGIIWTSPIVLVGWWGLRKLAWPLKLAVLAQIYVVASWNAWDQAAAYGPRMLISGFPIVALGLNRVRKSWWVLAVLVVLNLAMIVRFHLWIKEPTVDMGVETKVRAVQKIRQLIYWGR